MKTSLAPTIQSTNGDALESEPLENQPSRPPRSGGLRQIAQRRVHELKEGGVSMSSDYAKVFEEVALHQIELEFQLLESERSLRESQENYRILMENSPNIISKIKRDGTFDVMSATGFEHLGYSAEELRTNGKERFVHSEDLEAYKRYFQQELTTPEGSQGVEYRVFRKDGAMRWHRAVAAPVPNALGEVDYFIGNTMDITEEKINQEAMREAAAKAEAASRTKSEFVANMSHEIRTPMSGIIGMSELLLGSTLNATQERYARILQDNAHSLLSLINDVLDLSKIEAGKIEVEAMAFDLPEMLRCFVEEWQILAHEKGLDLKLVTDPNLPRFVSGDKNRLRQILVNLTSNAMKFTTQGEISILAHLKSCEAGLAGLQFEVVDTGTGIAREKLDLIFDRFMQVDASISRKFGGTGLGLTICKELTRLMGGEIGVESDGSTGSRFWFTVSMPLVGQSPADQDGEAAAPGDGVLVGRVLLVEDFVPNQLVITEMLLRLGVPCDVAETGEQALIKLASQFYDLVLMDVQLPGMDGLEITRRLRAGKSASPNHTIPVIALTAHALKEDRERCLLAGMNDYLSKPVERNLLQAILRRWLAVEGHPLAPPSETTSGDREDPPTPKVKVFDNTLVMRNLGGNLESWITFGESCLGGITQERERLRKSLQERDVKGAKTAVHRLKGAACYILADAVKAAAHQVECALAAGNCQVKQGLLNGLESETEALIQALRSDLRDCQEQLAASRDSSYR